MKAISGALAALKSGEGLKGQLMRGGVGSLAVKLGSTLLNVILAVVLARTLGAEGFGIYSFVFALITILAIPAQMGLPNLLVRETAKAQAHEDWSLIIGLWRWSTLMVLAMSVVLMVLGGVAARLFATRLPDGGLVVFYWGLILIPLVALGNLRGAALRGLRHVVHGQLPEFILRPTFLILLVLGAHFGLSTHALDASDAMMLHALASLIAFVIGAWLLLKVKPVELGGSLENRKLYKSASWLGSAIPLGIIEAMHIINANIALIFVGLWESPQNVAELRIALQAAVFVPFGLVALNLSIAPFIARMHTEGREKELRTLVYIAAWMGFIWGVAVFLLLVPFGLPVLWYLFGPEFVGAYLPLTILMAGQIVNVFVGPSGTVLPMIGAERLMAKALVGTGVMNIIMAALATYYFGVLGAASATAITIAIYNIIMWVNVIRHRSIDTSIIGLNVP